MMASNASFLFTPAADHQHSQMTNQFWRDALADACTKVGELGAMLRREGIYSSSLAGWRRARDTGGLGALEPKKRGPKVVVDARDKQVAELQRAVARAEARARQAEGLVELQKKMAEWMANQPRLEDETP